MIQWTYTVHYVAKEYFEFVFNSDQLCDFKKATQTRDH